MRLSEDKIKQGILHPLRVVRDAAVQYFSKSYAHDTSVLPFAIQAIEEHGWDGAFSVPGHMEGLPLDDSTLPWVVAQLQQRVSKDESLRNVLVDHDPPFGKTL